MNPRILRRLNLRGVTGVHGTWRKIHEDVGFTDGSDFNWTFDPSVVRGWNRYYLDEDVEMNVFGVIHIPYRVYEVPVMTYAEGGPVLGYCADWESLYVVARNKEEFFSKGAMLWSDIHFPKGHRFRTMTQADWEALPCWQEQEDKHRAFCTQLYNKDTDN